MVGPVSDDRSRRILEVVRLLRDGEVVSYGDVGDEIGRAHV